MTAARTLHFTNAWHPASGGIRTFYRALLDAAALEGRRMSLVVPADRDGYERAGASGGIYYLRAPRSPVFDTRYRLLLPHRYLAAGPGAIWQVLERERPDVVEICDKYALAPLGGLIRARARGQARPTVIGLSCERMDDNVAAWMPWLPGGRALARAYMRRVYLPQFDAHVANSTYTAAELRAARPALDAPVHICPMGVEIERFHPARRRATLQTALRARALASAHEPLLLYAGRLSPEKNVALLPDIAAALAQMGIRAKLIVAGDGPLLGRLRDAAAQRAPSHIVFYGHVGSREELADLLANVDLFVHPNPREPFGIGPLEAMASGTPVVVPAAGGVLEYATPRNAWIAATADAGAFARAIAHALASPSARAERAATARATAEAFSWQTIGARMLSLYDRIHAGRLAALAAHPASSAASPAEFSGRL